MPTTSVIPLTHNNIAYHNVADPTLIKDGSRKDAATYLAANMIAVSQDERQIVANIGRSSLKANAGMWSRLSSLYTSEHSEDNELTEVMSGGRQLKQQVDDYYCAAQRSDEYSHRSNFSSKGKAGIAISGLLLAGIVGAGYVYNRYLRQGGNHNTLHAGPNSYIPNSTTSGTFYNTDKLQQSSGKIPVSVQQGNFEVAFPTGNEGNKKARRSVDDKNASFSPERITLQKLHKAFLDWRIEKFGLDIKTSSLSLLKYNNPGRYTFLRQVIYNTARMIDAAITLLQRPSNFFNDIGIFPDADDYVSIALDVYFSSKNDSSTAFIKTYTKLVKDFNRKMKIPFHQDAISDEHTVNELVRVLGKMHNYAGRSCGKYNNNCIRYMTATVTQDGLDYEKENNLTPLYATVAAPGLVSKGYDKLDIVVTDRFFSLCTVDATQVLIHELLHYFTDKHDIFEVPRDSRCENSALGNNNFTVYEQLESVENRLTYLKNNIKDGLTGEWIFFVKNVGAILKRIPGFAETSADNQKELFINYYRELSDFRRLINMQCADFYANLIVSLAAKQMKMDGQITLINTDKFRG